MGTVVAQDIFQSKLDSIFIGMEGVTGIADDMVIEGRDKMEHDRNFLAFMEKCMNNNLTLNLEKIQLNSAFSPIMSSSFCSLLVCGKVRVCSYILGNVVRRYASSLLGSYVQQEYYVAVIQT